MFEVKSTGKGFLPPRMTLAQRSAINDPAEGLVVFCTNCGQDGTPVLSVFMAGGWRNLSGCIPPAKPVPATHIACPTQITWAWHPVPGAEGYLWSDSEDGELLDLGTDTSKLETGLVSNTMYTWYVWAYNSCGLSAPAKLTLATSPGVIDAPLAGVNIASPLQITWTWTRVDEALGYKWNNTNSYSSAIDLGTDTNYTENSLQCESIYTRYVWAYLDCIVSDALPLTDTTVNNIVPAPISGSHISSGTQVTWKWHPVANASGYMWNFEDNYATATDIGTDTAYIQAGLACGTQYTCYSWAYDECGYSASTTLIDTTVGEAPVSPVAATQVPLIHQITWKWHPVAGASGYKWNSVNNYETALDLGTDTSHVEGSLECETQYTRYAWAYSGCGVSGSVAMTQSTTSCWECGMSITINHVEGNVAPVTKTSIYGTVNNVPGETAKCWITSNLGSDHQATAVNDNTEASAGWYWQFNRVQGYKHDGSVRTPNTSWINYISEPAGWTTANDPCTSQMGSPWRIPTATEWLNVDGVGAWSNWYGPWNSLLKMHAAGYLYYNDGSLMARGSDGGYWSSSMANNYTGRDLYFLSTGSSLSSHPKAFGFTIRCLREP